MPLSGCEPRLPCRYRRNRMQASRGRWKAETSTCARRNIWRAMRASSSPPAPGSWADAVELRPTISALRVGEARGKMASTQVASAAAPLAAPTQPLAERSLLGAKLARGEFVTMVEVVPPKGTDIRKEVEGSRFLKSVGVDAVNIPDSPRASARMSNQALSLLVQRETGIEAILHYTCRDRNVLGIQSDLLGAAAVGIRNLICITGDPPKMGNYPDATAVFDVD